MRLMSFKSPRDSARASYATFGILKFSDMVHLQNIILLDKLSRNEMPVAIQSSFAVDFSHAFPTRADKTGLLNLPMVDSSSFGKHSIRFNSILSWNFIQSLLPCKISDFVYLKSDLKKCLIASY